jgi:RNA polymerase sigma-70 factor (ECF subfamily)
MRLKGTGDGSRSEVPAELIERCRRGDEAAWSELVEVTYRDVYSLCLRILADPNEAAEATQDAYVKAWRGLASFRGDALFTTWLYRVASNAAISRHRSRSRRRSHEAHVDDEIVSALPSKSSVEATAGSRLEVRELETAISKLPMLYRSAVVLRDVYGMSIDEMAKELGISSTAAKVRVHRARKMLRDMLFVEAQDAAQEEL